MQVYLLFIQRTIKVTQTNPSEPPGPIQIDHAITALPLLIWNYLNEEIK